MNHILLKNQTDLLNQLNYTILVFRLNGYLEIVNCTQSNATFQFQLIYSKRIYNSPMTNIIYQGDFICVSSQEFSFKIIKINFEFNKDKLLDIKTISEEKHDESLITVICIDKENDVSAATGSRNGLIHLWNLLTGRCDLKLKYHTLTKKQAILQIELMKNYLVSLNEDHQLFIWNRTHGELIKEFKFLSPIFDTNGINELTLNSDKYSLLNSIFNLFQIFTKRKEPSENIQDLIFKPAPTMCLYSNTILITGGCSCILLWNIAKGELVKKITIKKPNYNLKYNKLGKYSQDNFIKEIRLIERNCTDNFKKELLFKTSNNLKNVKKLVLITDYTDTFYLLKIPSNIIL